MGQRDAKALGFVLILIYDTIWINLTQLPKEQIGTQNYKRMTIVQYDNSAHNNIPQQQ